MADNRRAERHQIRFKMVFDDGSTYSAGYVRDISRTGMFLETANPLPVGAEVRLEPAGPTDALFEVSARVVRVVMSLDAMPDAETRENHGQIGMGLEFLALDADAQQSIEKMVLELEERQDREHKTGNLDPFLGVYVEDAPVGIGTGETNDVRVDADAQPVERREGDIEDELDEALDLSDEALGADDEEDKLEA